MEKESLPPARREAESRKRLLFVSTEILAHIRFTGRRSSSDKFTGTLRVRVNLERGCQGMAVEIWGLLEQEDRGEPESSLCLASRTD